MCFYQGLRLLEPQWTSTNPCAIFFGNRTLGLGCLDTEVMQSVSHHGLEIKISR